MNTDLFIANIPPFTLKQKYKITGKILYDVIDDVKTKLNSLIYNCSFEKNKETVAK